VFAWTDSVTHDPSIVAELTRSGVFDAVNG